MTADLIGQLRDPDPEIRSFAAYYLKNFGGEDAIEPLISALGDPEEEVRRGAVHSLAVLGLRTRQGRVVDHVEFALGDECPAVRMEAAMALGTWLSGMIGNERTIRALIVALTDADAEVAERAAFALENIYGRKDSYDLSRPLLEALEGEDEPLKEKVRAILARKIRIEKNGPNG
jgi:HEAT repeat protein